jgi:hypothetical protein
MGDMADYYAEMATCLPDWMTDNYPSGYGPNFRFDQFRDDVWKTKDGKEFTIRKMSDQHLLAAFKMFGDERFKHEMLIRMFEVMTTPKISF